MVPEKCPVTRKVKCYKAKERNLLITYYQRDSTITIKNSLHKYSKDNNYSEITFTELSKAISDIAYTVGIPASEFEVKRLEVGFNIETTEKPSTYLPLFTIFKNRELDKMKKDAFWYGVKWIFSEYQLKIYDKTEEVKRHDRIQLPQDILRFELRGCTYRQAGRANTA